MSVYRIPRHDIHLVTESASFGAEYRARIPVPISFIEEDPGLAFNSVFSGLPNIGMQVGDEVKVSAFDPGAGEWRDGRGVIREQARFLCMERNETGMILQKIGETQEFEPPKVVKTPDNVVPLDIVPHKEGGSVGWQVRDRGGHVLEVFVSEEQAKEFRDRSQGVPGIVGFTIKKGFGKWFVCDEQGAVKVEFLNRNDAEEWAQSGGQRAA